MQQSEGGNLSSQAYMAAARDERRRVGPRSEGELREENREQLRGEIERALGSLREVYLAAARWMALKEFVMQCDNEVSLVLEETMPENSALARRKIAASFPNEIGETDVDNQLDNFADDVMAAIAVENERRDIERKRRENQ